jgi:hypothetical protein
MAPTPGEVTAAIKALFDEAAMWKSSAGTMQTTANAAQGLTLGEGALSWASKPTGLVDTYGLIQRRVVRLLNEGARTFTDLSGALTTAATGYQRDENDAVHRMRNVW